MSALSFYILLPLAIAIAIGLNSTEHGEPNNDTLQIHHAPGFFSDKFQSKFADFTPNIMERKNTTTFSGRFTSKWTDRMSPYTDCRSRYAIENNVFYNGAGVRAVNSDFSDSDTDSFDDGDSAQYLFRERFYDDDYHSDSKDGDGGKSYSVEPASPSSSDGGQRTADSIDDSLENPLEDALSGKYNDNDIDKEYDFDFMAYFEWNESNRTLSESISPVEMAEGPAPEDQESWTKSVESVNSLSAYAQKSSENVSRLEFSKRNFLIAMFILMLNILGIVSYFVCYRLKHGAEGGEGGNESDFIIESDPEM